MINHKNSQGAIEFVILIGVVIFFFTMFFVFLGNNTSIKSKDRRTVLFEDVTVGIQDEINLASESSDGYYRKFTVPNEINGENFDINITASNNRTSSIYIRNEDRTIALALPIKPVIGQIKKGDNTIRKNQSVIYLNN